MISVSKCLLIATTILCLANPAFAQICKETGSNSSNSGDDEHGYIDCDMSYRDTLVTCGKNDPDNDIVTAVRRPSCPAKPMPMIETPNKSLIKDYSPYLYAYARDPNDRSLAYNGTYSVGTPGDAARVFGMVANVGGDIKRLAGCVPQYKFNPPTGANAVEEEAKQVRMQLDNCANQYILYTAMDPFRKERPRLLDDSTKSEKPISLKTDCQPLKIEIKEADNSEGNEYKAGEYLEIAWIKLLQDTDKRKNKSAWAEPHLPKGLKIDTKLQIPPPSDIKDIRLSQIAAIPYEEILDPSHPFTPRWDFSFNERERYSPLTDEYMEDTENAVYCAGVREAKNESNADKKADLEVKVDVLKFRQKKFQKGIMDRITFNTSCKKDSGDDKANFFKNLATSYCHDAASYWYTWIPCIVGDCDPQSKRIECWKCFKLDGKVDDDKKHPPCTTRHDGKDLKIKKGQPALFNGMKRIASCNPPPGFFRQKKHNIDKLCSDLRRPYTQINKLKMRYHNPKDTDYNAMKDGVPEGYTFKEYFGNHMPYPRLWDTGSSLQKTKSSDQNDQPADDTKGQYTAIVGVGREGAIDKASDDDKKKHPDERCKFGGWGDSQGFQGTAVAGFGKGIDGGLGNFNSQFGGANTGNGGEGFDFKKFIGDSGGSSGMGFDMSSITGGGGGGGGGGMGGGGSGAGGGFSFGNMDFGSLGDNNNDYSSQIDSAMTNANSTTVGGYKIRVPDGITSWTELKLYQANTVRAVQLVCLGRYEKVFRPGGTEALLQMAAGGEWAYLAAQRCPKTSNGACTQMNFKEYQNNISNINRTNENVITQTMKDSWPVAWRGYFIADGSKSADGKDAQFPNFPGVTPATETGLDKAEVGDIILLPRGASGSSSKPGLAKLAFVAEVNLPRDGKCIKREDCYVRVQEADNGKWPDVCGTTDTNGQLKSRYFYRPGSNKELYGHFGHSTYSCEDTKLWKCEFQDWTNAKLYRLRNDVRKGCAEENPEDCQ